MSASVTESSAQTNTFHASLMRGEVISIKSLLNSQYIEVIILYMGTLRRLLTLWEALLKIGFL